MTGSAPALLLDTSVFIARETGRPLRRVPGGLPEQVRVSVVTVAELRAGVLSAGEPAVRSRRLDTLTSAQVLEPLPVDVVVANAWADLRVALRDAGRRMPVNDSWIAATALAHGLPVVTQDDDYDGVPGLTVLRV